MSVYSGWWENWVTKYSMLCHFCVYIYIIIWYLLEKISASLGNWVHSMVPKYENMLEHSQGHGFWGLYVGCQGFYIHVPWLFLGFDIHKWGVQRGNVVNFHYVCLFLRGRQLLLLWVISLVRYCELILLSSSSSSSIPKVFGERYRFINTVFTYMCMCIYIYTCCRLGSVLYGILWWFLDQQDCYYK